MEGSLSTAPACLSKPNRRYRKNSERPLGSSQRISQLDTSTSGNLMAIFSRPACTMWIIILGLEQAARKTQVMARGRKLSGSIP